MPRQRVGDALQARGDALPATASLEAMQQRLVACLLRERRETSFPGSTSTTESSTEPESALGVSGQALPLSQQNSRDSAGWGPASGNLADGPALSEAADDSSHMVVCSRHRHSFCCVGPTAFTSTACRTPGIVCVSCLAMAACWRLPSGRCLVLSRHSCIL